MDYIVKEIHRNGTKSHGLYDVELCSGYTVESFNSKVVLHSSQYKDIFYKKNKDSSYSKRRLSIVKITAVNEETNKKASIYREVVSLGISNLNSPDCGLTFDSIQELGICNNKNKECKVTIEKGCWLMYYLTHPDDIARFSIVLAILSTILAIISIILAILTLI